MAASTRIEASPGPLASFFSVLFTTLAAYFLHVPNYTKRTCASPLICHCVIRPASIASEARWSD